MVPRDFAPFTSPTGSARPRHGRLSGVRPLRLVIALFATLALLAPAATGVLFAAVPELQATVTDTRSTAVPGELLTYTVQVRNTGASPLANVRVRLQIASDVTFVVASDGPTDLGGGLYEWTVASLPANSLLFRYLSVTVNNPLAPGMVITTTAAVDQVGDPTANSTTDTTTVEAPAVTLNPTSLTFGPQQVGTTSSAQTTTLTNNGNQPLSISSIVANAPFNQTNDCGASLAISASCTITVTFSPTSGGLVNGTLSVNDNALGSPHQVALQGTGTQPAVTLTPASLSFGGQRVGTTSAAQQVTLTNSGSAPLTIGTITASGDFAQTNDCPAALAANTFCTISVTFTPTAPGARSGAVTIANDAPGNPHTVALDGTGTEPGVQLAPGSLSFGNQAVATSSVAQQVTLTNSGDAPLVIAGITTSGDFAQTNNCPAALGPGASCTIDVTFTPTAIGTRLGQLSVSSDATGSPHTINLDGNGVSAAVQISPTSLDFGSFPVGNTSSAQTVTITNTGNTGLTFTAITVSGDFSLSNSCPLSPTTLAPNTSCTVSITFTPTAMGTRTGQLVFTNNAPGSPQSVNLTGVGLQAALSVSPPSIDFGSQRLNTMSAPQQVAVVNTGNVPVAIAGITISGNFAQTNDCPASLAPNAGCTITITFTPTALGPLNGQVSIANDAPNNPHLATLTGTGTQPQADLSTTSLTFGNQQVSSTSAPQSVTLTNGGNGPLAISSITISGDFAQTNDCPPALAAGASCTINVTFRPLAMDLRNGTLTVTSDAASSPNTVSLSGVGIQPVVSLDPTSLDFGSLAVGTTSPTQAITLTNTGSQPLALASISTSSGFVQTNNCPVAPLTLAIGASCSISVSFTPTTVGPVSGALTITSNAPSSPHTLTLTGSGSGAVYTSSPAAGTITMSSVIGAFNTINITVSNDGNQTLTVSAPAEMVTAPFSLAPVGGYSIQAGGASQVVAVTCAPTAAGPFTQQLTYTTNDPSEPTAIYTVVCTGTTAATAGYSSSPAPGSSWTIGSTTVGSSATSDLTVSESGTAALTVGLGGGTLTTAITGANAGDFAVVAPASFPLTIADGGASQRITVRCTPSGAGTRSAALRLTTNDPSQPTVSYALTCTGQGTTAQRQVYLPVVTKATTVTPSGQPDLVASVSINPSSVAAGQPVVVTVTVINQGTAAASEFWVDFYINPSEPPTATNQPWNKRCGMNPCYGIAWYVTQQVAPGQSITLTSQQGNYYGDNTIWNGTFAAGTSDLYVYVDSWNPTVAEGAIAESNEANNRGELHGLNVTGPATTTNDMIGRAEELPERPARPAR